MPYTFHPIVAIEGHPHFVNAPHIALGPSCWWMLPAFKRSVQVGSHYLRLVGHSGMVAGLVISDQPILKQLMVTPAIPVQSRLAPSTAVVQHGRVLSATHERWVDSVLPPQVGDSRLRGYVSDGLHSRWRPLHGSTALLVDIRPCEAVIEPLFACLSRAQLESASGAVAGLSNKEIAQHRNCGVETVRSHLKTIYRRLGSNRVELRQLIDEWDLWCHLLCEVQTRLIA